MSTACQSSKHDGPVVVVANAAAHVNTHVPPHGLPAPCLRIWVGGEDSKILDLAHAAAVPAADVDGFTAGAVAEFDPVRLAAVAAAEGLVAQHVAFIDVHVLDGQEEPLALAAVGRVLAAVAGVSFQPRARPGPHARRTA